MLFSRARHRRSFSSLPTAAERPKPFRIFVMLCIGVLLVLWGGWRGLQALGILNQVQRMRAELSVTGGDVNVSLEGGELRKAADAKLYADDRVVSNSGGRAQMKFFDGTLVALEEVSDVTITRSEKGTKHSTVSLLLQQGKIVVVVPSTHTMSGSMQHIVQTAAYTATLPAGTKAVFSARGLQVADAEGLGVTVQTEDADEPVYIGEGQQLLLPDGAALGSLYEYRSSIDAAAARLVAGLSIAADVPVKQASTATGTTFAPVGATQDALVLSAPLQNELVSGSTVQVRGQAGPAVQRVRINGHDVKLDPADGSFSQELAVTRGETMEVLAEALDIRDVAIAQQQRTVRLKPAELGKPTITSPATDGSVYRTGKMKFDIRGTAPAGATGIVVNDYKLMFFKQGDASWTYLANAELGNVKEGQNVFTVYAVDSAGTKSPTTSITIILEAGATDGLVTAGGSTSAGNSSSEPEQVDETSLPKNAPLSPGSLTVSAPTTGAPYTATESEVLIEGNTSKDTDSVWVNGYKLRLYKSGATFWNYYARTQYGTLKKGKNTYVVNTRNAKGEILDTLTYEINY